MFAPSSKASLLRWGVFVLCIFISAPFLHSADNLGQNPREDGVIRYQSRIPLGWESFKVRSSGTCFYILGTVESPRLEGWRKVTINSRSSLVDAGGQPVRVYPDQLQFRITASARENMLDNQPFPIASDIELNDYLLRLRFRLKVFHGIATRTARPVSVEAIGMPADIAYDERIYRVSFDLKQIPIEDRVVLEVISPNGERLSKFHVDLF